MKNQITTYGNDIKIRAKAAAAVDAGILGYHMYLNGKQFYSGDGIVAKDVDNTIDNVGRMAREGMG